MLEYLWLAFSFVGFILLILNTHEYGHYVVARLLGVARENVKVRFSPPPAHVALRAGKEWLSPDNPKYIDRFMSYTSRLWHAWLFVAGGFMVETGVVSGIVWLLLSIAPIAALLLASISLGLFMIYVLFDTINSLVRRRPYGDTSSLYLISPLATIVFILGVVAIKGVVAWMVFGRICNI